MTEPSQPSRPAHPVLGQHPAPTHVLAHLSDTHLLGGGRQLYGTVDSWAHLDRSLDRLVASGSRPDALVFTGDLADVGEIDAYEGLRDRVERAAAAMGSQVIWVIGNHDDPAGFAKALYDEDAIDQPRTGSPRPQDRAFDVGGLRIVALDTTVPGYHHGDLTDDQLVWLGDVLADPAPHGSVLAVHHPPMPTPLPVEALIELRGQDRLAAVLRGSDVRMILGGHWHATMFGTFAGIPVAVAAGSCYTIDSAAPTDELRGVDGARAINLVHVYPETIAGSVVPIDDHVRVTGLVGLDLERLAAMPADLRTEAFSSKTSTFSMAPYDVKPSS